MSIDNYPVLFLGPTGPQKVELGCKCLVITQLYYATINNDIT